MKVIIDLMEAYSDHIGLPLFLVNSNGELDYKIAGKDSYFSLNESMIHLSELQNISLNLTIPTVVSVSDDSYKSSLYYIIMPIFSVSDSEYFLAAGPFIAESIGEIKKNNQGKHLPIIIHEEEVEVLIGKMQKLYRLLIKKSKDESNLSIPKQIVSVLQTIGKLDCDIADYDRFLENILEELLQIDSLDFLGVAEKNKDDIYVIKHIYGDKVQNLAENRFFIGEGLLGKAVILGNDFYWSKDNEPQRAEFFNRYGIFPTQLFGFPLKQEKIVDGILFGGSFQKNRISENLMGLLKCVVRIVSQKKNVYFKLMESHYIQAIFANWLDLIDININSKDSKHMSYKILDFCQILNKGLFSYFTSVDGDFLSRGNNQPEDHLIHQDALINVLNQTSAKLWVENNCIHFNLPLYGFFTIGFYGNTGLQQETYILQMVVEFLSREGSSARNDANRSNAAIFSLLHTNMQEMNKNQFRLSNLAIDVVKKLMNSLQIDEGEKEILLNICSVFPYDFDYLKKHISHTNEWQFLLEIGTILQEKDELNEYRIEVKILAFIYKMVIQGKKNDKFEFLNEDLRELCFSTYEASLKLINLDEVTLEVDHKQIEDITDLKSVISTLALTAREKEILYLIIEGLNNHELGQYLNISVHTVKNHVTNIFKKLNVTDRIQAMAKIYRIKFEES